MGLKRCGKCAEKIQDAALVCRFCGGEQKEGIAERTANPNAPLWAAGIIAVLVVLALLPNPMSNKTVAPPAEVAPEPAAAKDVYGGCLLRGLDNLSLNFSGIVKKNLRNPSSFEHVSTVPGIVQNGIFPVTMTYRGTNGFGAIDTSVATGEIKVRGCGARIISM